MEDRKTFRFVPQSFRHSFRSAAWRGAAIGLLCALICWGLNHTSLIRALENWQQDRSFAVRGTRNSSANLIIVALDEASLDELQKPLMFFSPELAKVVTYLHEQGAAAIGVDIQLPNRGKTMQYLLPGQPGSAEAMGRAVGLAGNVVLPEWLLLGEEPALPPFEWTVPSDRPWADLGFVDLSPDADSYLRRQKLRIEDDRGGIYPNMALALLVKARGLSQQWLDAPELKFDGAAVPLDAEGCLRINYVGPAATIPTVSFRDVLAEAGDGRNKVGCVRDAPPATAGGDARRCVADAPYNNAIVLIGSTVGMFQDRFLTPFASQMSGVEVHANVAATLWDRAFITTPWFLATPLMLAIIGAAMGAVLVRCSLEAGALVTVAHHLAWRGLAAGAFCLANWRLEMVSMLLLGVLLYGTIFAMRWRWIRRMMGMVKSEAVARALEAGGAKLDLRGQQREITVLFCDIRDFTPFSERHSPHEVVRLLNAFFAVAVPAIEAQGGTVNQYIGDAVMVIFGAPQPQPDHALRAVLAAEEVVRRVHSLGDRWKQLGAAEFRIGIGIHTGKAVVGTVGSPRRLDYTAIGDTVNTAARIESANKELNAEVLISQATLSALPEEERNRICAMGEPKHLAVKGKQETLLVYSLTAV